MAELLRVTHANNETSLEQFFNSNNIYEIPLYQRRYKWDAPKIRQVIKDNPNIDLRMVFQDPYKRISKKSKTTYAKWCERYGILWCAAHCIPVDWLKCGT